MPAGVSTGNVVGEGWLRLGVGIDTSGAKQGLAGLGLMAGKTAKQIGRVFGMYAGAAGLAMAVKSSTEAFVEFDKALKNSWTLVNKTNAEMQKSGNAVRAMARQYNTAATQSEKALYQIWSATFYGADSMNILEQATRGAAAGLAGLMDTADMMTTILNAYNKSASESAHINDLLFTTIRFGKCLVGSSHVLLADGGYKRIDELEKGARVVSFDGESFLPMDATWVDQGVKPTVKLATRLGREITTTWSHPYLTNNGWKKVSELSIGDKIAVPTYLPYFGTKHVPKEEAGFLGLWIAEGYASKKGSPTLGSKDYGEQIKGWAKYFGCTYNVNTQEPHNTPVYTIVQRHGNVGKSKNPCKEFLKSYGIAFGNAIDKHIPDEVFTWDKESVKELLHWLFNGDGSLSRGSGVATKHRLQLKSKSETLIRQVNHLLLRFGIVGHIRKLKYTKATCDRLKKPNNCEIWVWHCEQNFYIRRFIELIGIDRPKVEEALNVINVMPRVRNGDQLSYEDAEEIRAIYKSGGILQREVGEKFGISQQQVSKIIAGDRWADEGFYPESTEIKRPYLYDSIKEIVPVNDAHVYDLMVPGLHNFVAEDIIAHNTTYSELASQLGRLAGVSAPTGASIEDMTAAIATLTRQGIETDWAITSLRQTLMQFIKPTKNLKEAINDLGYAGGSAMIKQEGFAKALRMVTKWAKDNNVEMDQMFTNVRAVTAVLPLATTAAAGYALDQKRMAESAGQAALAFKKQTQSISYQLQKFATLFSDLAISVGKTFVPAMMGAVKALEAIAGPLRVTVDLFNDMGGGYFVAITAGITGLTAALWLAVKAWKAVTAWAVAASAATVAASRTASTAAAAWTTTATTLSAGAAGGATSGSMLSGGVGGLLAGLGGGSALAGLGLAAGSALGAAFTVKQAINFDFILGNVTGIEAVKQGLIASISEVLGAAITGAMIGAMFGVPGVGMAAGAAVGATHVITMEIIHIIRKEAAGSAELAKAQTQAYGNLPFEFPSGSIKNMADLATAISGASMGSKEWQAVLKHLTEDLYNYTLQEGYTLKGTTKEAVEARDVFSELTHGLKLTKDQAQEAADIFMKAYREETALRIPKGASDEEIQAIVSKYITKLNSAFGMEIDRHAFNEVIEKLNKGLNSGITKLQNSADRYGFNVSKIGDISADLVIASNIQDPLKAISKVGDIINDLTKSFTDAKIPPDVATEIVYKIMQSLSSDFPKMFKEMLLGAVNQSEDGLSAWLLELWKKEQERLAAQRNPPPAPTVENISTDWAADQKKFADLKSELEKGGLTADEVTKHWKDLTDVQKKWSGLMPILSKLGYDVSGSMSGVIEGWKSYLALDTAKSWMQKAQDLAKIMQDGTASTQERANAEKGLVSLYGEVAASAKSTIPAIRGSAKATMDFIAETHVDLSKYVTDWGTSIQSLVDILKNSKVPQDRIDAYSSLMSWGAKLAAMEKGLADTEYAFLIPAIQTLEDKIKEAGVEIPAAINPTVAAAISYKKNIASLIEAYNMADKGTLVHTLATLGLASALGDAEKKQQDLIDADRATDPELQALIDQIHKLGITSNDAMSAVGIFNNAIASISSTLSSVASQITATFSTLQQSIMKAGTLGEQMAGVAGLLAGAGNVQAYRENLQKIITGKGFEESFVKWAKGELAGLGGEPTPGKTYAQIAREEEAAAKKAASEAKQAAQKALQDAKDAAAAAQKAFKDQFSKPILEGIRSGDWKTAAATIREFAKARGSIIKFAKNLSTANGTVLNEIDVIGLILGAQSKLMSAMDDQIKLMQLAGEDTLSLEAMKQGIEDLLDPLGGLKKKIREILGIETPKIAAQDVRAIAELIRGTGGTGFATGGFVSGSGDSDSIPAMLTPGEFVLPRWMMKIPGLSALIFSLWGHKFANGGCVGGTCPINSGQMSDFSQTVSPGVAAAVAGTSTTSKLNEKMFKDLGLATSSAAKAVDGLASSCTTCGKAALDQSKQTAQAADQTASAFWDLIGKIDAGNLTMTDYKKTISDLQNALNSGTLSAEEQVVAQAKLDEMFKMTVDAGNGLISNIENEISAYEMFGWNTDELSKRLKEATAGLKNMTVAELEWSKWIKASKYGKVINAGVNLLPKDWQPQIHGFLSALDPSSVDNAINGLIGILDEGSQEIANGILSITSSIISGNIPQAIFDGIQLIFGLIMRGMQERLKELKELFALYAEKIKSAFDKITGSLSGIGGLIASIISDTIGMAFKSGSDLLSAGISMAINAFTGFIGIIKSTIGSMKSYQATQEAWGKVIQSVKDLFGEFLWPLAAAAHWLEKFLGIVHKTTDAMKESLNVPSGYKVTNAEWKAAMPGQAAETTNQNGIPDWAQAFGASLAAGIMAVLENLGLVKWGDWLEGISSWGDLVNKIASGDVDADWFKTIADAITGGGDWGGWLDIIQAKAIDLWTWITGQLPQTVASVTAAVQEVSKFLDDNGITLDSILGGVKTFVTWLNTDMPKDVADFLHYLQAVKDAVVKVKDWILANFPTWDELEAKISEFETDLAGLDSLPGIKTEMANITAAIDALKTILTYAIALAAGAIVGGIAGALIPLTLGISAVTGLAGALVGAAGGALFTALMSNIAGSFASGGVVPGAMGAPQLALVHGGETIIPPNQQSLMGVASGGTQVIDNTIYLDGGLLWHGMKKANQREERRKTGSSYGSRAWHSS